MSEHKITVKADEGIFTADISHDNFGNAFVSCNGHIFNIHRDDLLIKEDTYSGLESSDSESQNAVFTPMPGKVVKVNVKPGDKVAKGDRLVVVEAMKMENSIVSPRDAVIEKVNVKQGHMVDSSRPLIVFETPETDD
jgi:3-methylcrotonyl-CoA carboxylase alpha subunit